MKNVKVVFSGITGRTGMEALRVARNMEGVEISGGLMRDANHVVANRLADVIYDGGPCGARCYQVGYLELATKEYYLAPGFIGRSYNLMQDLLKSMDGIDANSDMDMDVLVDFSHPSVFDVVLDLAMRTHVPLISGTSGLSEEQMMKMQKAAKKIPIFRGGNFRFKVKKFLDDAVALAKSSGVNLTLYENFYEGKRSLPSNTAKVLQHRIQETTGKRIEISSRADLPKEDLECQWQFGNVVCKTEGLEELAENVLQIARVMVTKEPGFYELDDIWSDLNI